MAKSEKQKLKLLYIMQCLMEKTDEEHAVTTQDIIDYLALQGIAAERKSYNVLYQPFCWLVCCA